MAQKRTLGAQNPNACAAAATAMPVSIALMTPRPVAATKAEAATASQIRGSLFKVAGRTIEISTDVAMYFRKASMRGVMTTYDMMRGPLIRVAKVIAASSETAAKAVHSSTMTPGSRRAAGQRA